MGCFGCKTTYYTYRFTIYQKIRFALTGVPLILQLKQFNI